MTREVLEAEGSRDVDGVLVGIDAGLTSIKAVAFAPDGEIVNVASGSTPVDCPARNRREVELEKLWDCVTSLIRRLVENGPFRSSDVLAVGVAGHGHGLYALDEDGEQVRPGIKSTDSRATDVVAEWEADGTARIVQKRLGYAPFAADPLSLLEWVKRNEPDAYDRIRRLLFCKDYLKYRLTGRACTDEMEASVFRDPNSNEYDREVFEALGHESCFDALPDVVPSDDCCGSVTATAATETGLEEGTQVASGLHDVGATALGVGAHTPHQGVLIVGTWGQSIVVLDEPTPETGDGSEGEPHGLTRRFLDGWIRYKGNRSAAACVDWFVRNVGHEWRQRAASESVDEFEMYNRVVSDVPAGAEGLLFHPYLDGSTDNATDGGGFYGLRSDHTSGHMLRSIYEGVAIAQVSRLRELAPQSGLKGVRFGGGGARSDVWSDIFASTLGDEIVVSTGREAGARGTAICAAIASGLYQDHETAVDRMVPTGRIHEPDRELLELYRERRDIFEDALESVRPIWRRLNRCEREQQ
ncbi:MAG: FGGY-family carbohydrate kinase [Natronomonas sp.]|jgi:sugar (pentulose or hexulose) kinase|uniref:FGGY-family carbohydrate kinase n=1 Tax=Natronomonas sp. TaxID=2184060 RepID=UPI0028707D26|nr:FGGY-family carbohydrate kinase [Natronomonas sp.]MDR9429426.1 FGGY-family carbohydrate kinase [Natronomonas sp.]